ncbi:MAG: heparinase II/III family protein [Opitutaceae bacterium]|nr:heparinase II/III family protein [Opitutaceae bacterium]
MTRFPRLLVRLVAGSLLIGAGLAAAAPAKPPKVTPAETTACRDAHLAEWRARVTPGEPRLFVAAADWPALLAELREATGKRAEYRQLVKDAADRILTQQIPEYKTPEERVTPALNLLQAREEGWLRGYGDQLAIMALAARVFPQPAYGKKLRELALAACRFETWGRHGRNGELHDMDLAAGHMMCGLAVAYDWNRALFSEGDRAVIRDSVRARMNRMLSGLHGKIFWADWYDQNHNHVSAAGLGLAGLAFLEEIPEAPDWLAGALVNFHRVGPALAADGSSYEGLPYWSYGRSFILQFIEGVKNVTDAADIYKSEGMRQAIPHRAGGSTPGFNGVIMWSDSRGFDVQGPHHILYKLASVYRDGRGQFLADNLPFIPQGGGAGLMWTLLWRDPSVAPEKPRGPDYHAAVWDTATSRSGWGPDDYMLAVKAGQNSNHHTHLDAGAIALNVAGGWMLLAPGYGFGGGQPGFFDNNGKRYEFFSNASESHSVLLINGRNQRFDRAAGGRLEHLVSNAGNWWAEVDLSEAYAGVTGARRRLLHRRGDYVLVLDDVRAPAPVSAEWLAQMPPETRVEKNELTLETPDGGGLRVRSLDTLDFYARQPTTRAVDVSLSRIATFAVKTSGTDLRMAHLLQPARLLGAAPVLRAQRNDTSAVTHILVGSQAWRDDILVTRAGPARLSAGDASGEASVLAVRTQAGRQASILTRDATKLVFSGCRFDEATPFDLCAEKIATDAGWRIELATPFHGKLSLPAGLTLFDSGAAAVRLPDGARLELPAGRYMLASRPPSAGEIEGARETIPAAPPAAQPARKPALSGARVGWEAEAPRKESFGRAREEQLANASGGRALMSIGTETPWHRISWPVIVPKKGAYRLRLRYNLSQPRCKFLVQAWSMSGEHRDYHCVLPGPKGWGGEREWLVKTSGWREADAVDESGRDILIQLEAGKQILTIASPTEGFNLDAITLDGTKKTAAR